jgi:hypothetical protein
LLFIIIEIFVDGGCANVSSTMLLFVKRLFNCMNNGDSIVVIDTNIVVIDTNPINITAKICL